MNTVYKLIGVASAAVMLTGCWSTSNTAMKSSASGAQSGKGYGSTYGQTYAQRGEDDGTISVNSANPKCRPTRAMVNREQHYFFGFDSNNITRAYKRELNKIATYLTAHPNTKIRLEGNADDRGSREYNIGLGSRRVNAVARQLKAQGVSPHQISKVSYGAERPAVRGRDEHSRSCNRRVDLAWE